MLQMKGQAYDLGTPQSLTGSEVNITVFVTRNNNPPFFVNAPYLAVLDETTTSGTFVYDTSATDQDIIVSTEVLFLYVCITKLSVISSPEVDYATLDLKVRGLNP